MPPQTARPDRNGQEAFGSFIGMKEPAESPLEALVPQSSGDTGITAVIDTPQGSRHKYKFDSQRGVFKLSHALPAGMSFPLSYGFIPGTESEDGDPLDVLVFADDSFPVGCVVETRLIGVLEGRQTERGKSFRNDRLLAVASMSRDHGRLRSVRDLEPHLLEELKSFFEVYNALRGRTFKLLQWGGPARASQLLKRSTRNQKKER